MRASGRSGLFQKRNRSGLSAAIDGLREGGSGRRGQPGKHLAEYPPKLLHMLAKYTTVGKTEKQIRRDRDFSDPEKNPVTKDPRSKKQIAAYREKERNRRKLLADMKQHKEYRRFWEEKCQKIFAKFREMKYNGSGKWEYLKGLKRYLDQYPTSNRKFYDAGERIKETGD